ncbi:MAG: SURF1 family cytochrome oxidase biogenesis protein [Rhodoglobus sp.]
MSTPSVAPTLTPTLWKIARRPRWIGALILALAVAAGFAALGQWQIERSFESAVAPDQETEKVVPLESVAKAQSPVLSVATGQLVSVTAQFVSGDYEVLSGRVNLAAPGYWVVGHAVLPDGASLAVAMGWAKNADVAASAIKTLEQHPPTPAVTGRYLPSESPQETDFEHGVHSVLAVPALVNEWSTAPDGVYGGYLISHEKVEGLARIDSPAPSTEVSLNLLNIFYAVEWAIFAGFALFLWYRLVKDAWEAALELGGTVISDRPRDASADGRPGRRSTDASPVE